MHGTRVRARARVSAGDPRRSPPYHIIIRTAGRARKADVSVSSRAARDEFLFFHTRRVAKPRVEPRGEPRGEPTPSLLPVLRRPEDVPDGRSFLPRHPRIRPRLARFPPGGAPRRRASLRRRGRSRGRHRVYRRLPLVLVRLARVIPHLRERSHGLRATERGSGPGPVGRGATVHLRRRRRLLRAVQPGHAPRATFRTAPRAHRVWVFVRTRGRVAETVRVTVGVSGRAADGRVVVRPRAATVATARRRRTTQTRAHTRNTVRAVRGGAERRAVRP